MEFSNIISYVAAFFSVSLAVFVLYRDRHSFVHRIFAVGMIALAVESGLTGLCVNAIMSENMSYWLRLRFFATAVLPGIWFLFSLSFSRANYKEFIGRWKWVIVAIFLLPLATVIFFGNSFFVGRPLMSPSFTWVVLIGWPGHVFNLFILIGAVLILMNLERTLRDSTGQMRWQIKFMVLGIGCLFAVRIYTASQTMLFHSLNVSLELVNSGALILACLMILRSLTRTRLLDVDFYPSQAFLYNSFTVLFVGVYLISVGLLAKVSLLFNGGQNVPFRAFFVLLAIVGLIILLLSDRLRKRMRRFISQHFSRPLYDYRKEWTKFTRGTTSVMEIKDLCTVVVHMISKTFEVLSVSVWLCDDAEEQTRLFGSTDFPEGKTDEIKFLENDMTEFIRILRLKKLSSDFDYVSEKLPGGFENLDDGFLERAHIQYCIPLIAGDRFLGILTLFNRVGGEPLTIEDFDLLGTIADQVAASLLNLMLSERLREAKQMEAFQTMSAFFVHDLKNLASKLSLTMQNLPTHFDNPEFRRDTLQTISQSLEKINLISSSLVSLSQKLELHLAETDINDVVAIALSGLDGSLREKLVQELQTAPKIALDSERIQNVLTNLVLNAHEATGDTGNIEISTGQEDGWVFLTVRDNGCGISKEFMEKSLFHPFQTTKNRGMGIGLYHSKAIVEAHNGRIEVESEEGKGSTVKVLLPLKGAE
jgi:putative PEP-CTERM system histidine kinase